MAHVSLADPLLESQEYNYDINTKILQRWRTRISGSLACKAQLQMVHVARHTPSSYNFMFRWYAPNLGRRTCAHPFPDAEVTGQQEAGGLHPEREEDTWRSNNFAHARKRNQKATLRGKKTRRGAAQGKAADPGGPQKHKEKRGSQGEAGRRPKQIGGYAKPCRTSPIRRGSEIGIFQTKI